MHPSKQSSLAARTRAFLGHAKYRALTEGSATYRGAVELAVAPLDQSGKGITAEIFRVLVCSSAALVNMRSKDEIRERVWSQLQQERVARFRERKAEFPISWVPKPARGSYRKSSFGGTQRCSRPTPIRLRE